MIKKKLENKTAKITKCWIPSHVNTYGDEREDTLTDIGAKKDKSCAPVTFRIVKAKINMK